MGFKWSSEALHKEALGDMGKDMLFCKISKCFELTMSWNKKKVMYHSALGKPKSSESSLKLKQFCKSTQYMQQLSLCAFKLKINGCNFKNGRHAGHFPQVFIQIQINEEFKVH